MMLKCKHIYIYTKYQHGLLCTSGLAKICQLGINRLLNSCAISSNFVYEPGELESTGKLLFFASGNKSPVHSTLS